MPIDILMPQLSPTMTEGRLARWTKAEGDKISAGDVIAEVETDKATMEVEASDDGILHKIIGEIGADLLVGSPIAVLRGKDEKVAADYMPTSKAKKAEAAPAAAPVAEASATPAAAAPAPVAAAPVAATVLPKINTTGATAAPVAANHSTGGRTKASPLARRLASQQNVDITTVIGTGPHGRVVAQDVLTGGRTAGAGRPITRMADSVQKLTPMRKAIASRLTASKQTVPHFYLSTEVNMNALMSVRTQLNSHLESQKIKVSVNDFILKASALALKDFPAANAAWNVDSVVQFGNVDISVAVSIDGGLITPVVANADQKSIVAISAEVKQLASDARAGKLKPEQYEGGSFSLSNLGMYGVDDFSAIINPPQAAILACGAATERAVVTEGGIDVASVMKMTLSVDHRVIDGALGAELLGRIKHYLEAPVVLVM